MKSHPRHHSPTESTTAHEPVVKRTPAASAVLGSYDSNPLSFIVPSWSGFKQNAKAYLAFVGLYLALGVVILLTMLYVGLIFHSIPIFLSVGFVMALILTFVGGVKLAPGVIRLQLAMARGKTLSFRQALATPTRLGWRLMGATALVGLIVGLGLIAFIVPGIVFAVWFSQTSFLIVDQALSIRKALGRSRELVRNRAGDIIGMYGLVQSVGLLAFIPILGRILSVGCSIVLAPVLAMRYDQLVQLKQHSDGSDIRTHPANYLLAILAIVATATSIDQSAANLQNSLKAQPLEKTRSAY